MVDMVDAICGLRHPDQDMCQRMVAQGLMVFCGDQHNQRWEWNRRAIGDLSPSQAITFYSEMKRAEVMDEMEPAPKIKVVGSDRDSADKAFGSNALRKRLEDL